MSRKLTITVPDDVYEGLRSVVDARRISRFLSDLARPHVVQCDRAEAYARTAEDEVREKQALDWAEEFLGDAGAAAAILGSQRGCRSRCRSIPHLG